MCDEPVRGMVRWRVSSGTGKARREGNVGRWNKVVGTLLVALERLLVKSKLVHMTWQKYELVLIKTSISN
jgi:hypothetical protein